tara:strand:+ start:1393 stop:2967 length:1575 start_codon:yes stop_codon:yes gene_type:complete
MSVNRGASQSMTQQQSATGGAATGDIPDLVKIGTIPTDTAIDVATEILEPVSFSQSECRFVLSNKGILHSNSRITFGLDSGIFTAPIGSQDAFYPINIGVAALLQRVRLTIGGKTISEIEDFAHYYAYESMFVTPEQNKEREQVFTSRVGLGVRPTLDERAADYESAGLAANNIESIDAADSVLIDNGQDFDYNPVRVFPFLPRGVDPTPSRQIMAWGDAHNKGVFSILIADLFPFLKMNQLPLFMLSEQVAIHLTFTPRVTGTLAVTPSSRIVTTLDAAGAKGDTDATILRDQVKMVADYIFYPQEMMEQYAQANANMSFNYVDYQFVKRSVSQAEFAGQLIQNVGGAGRIVNKVCVQVENKKPFDQGLINNYGSDSPLVSATGNGTITSNLRYNDLFLFPIDVTNSARQFHNIMMTEGRVPHVSRDIYSGQGQLAADVTRGAFEDYPMGSDYDGLASALDCDVRSRANWSCYRLNRNERVNSRGIEVYDKRTTMSGGSTLRAWIQVVRMAQLKDGKMEVMYA